MTTIFFFKWSVRNRFLHFLLDSNDDDDSATIRYTSVLRKKREMYIPAGRRPYVTFYCPAL